LVLQGSGVTYEFVQAALPMLDADGLNLEVVYVSSVELFDRLPEAERQAVFPGELAQEAMGITGFTLPTLYRWVRSDVGLQHSMHPFMNGHYLGSGAGEAVIHEAGLDGEAQYRRIKAYVEALKASR
jgi:transketolase